MFSEFSVYVLNDKFGLKHSHNREGSFGIISENFGMQMRDIVNEKWLTMNNHKLFLHNTAHIFKFPLTRVKNSNIASV